MRKNLGYFGPLFMFLMVISMGTGIYQYAYIFANFSESGFTTTTTGKSEESLSTYIVNGADSFTTSYSTFLAVLNRVETSGETAFDPDGSAILLEQALTALEKARSAYESLLKAAGEASYNPLVVERLMSFDYAGFQQQKGLNPSILKIVEAELCRGDTRGIYVKIYTAFDDIAKRLREIKAEVESGRFPVLENLWRTNQVFSETLLLGQYTSEIFLAIL